MLERLEKNLCIDIDQTDAHQMLEVFELCKSTQVPVVRDGKVLGLISIFDVCNHIDKPIDVSELMDTDIIIAGDEEGVFSFATSKQCILPFVDESGKLEGFANRITQKCYLPNEEYMRVLDNGVDELFNNLESNLEDDGDGLGKVKNFFNMVFESNYNGLYITVGKGKTIGVNKEAIYLQDVEIKETEKKDDSINISFSADEASTQNVNIIQHMQERREFMLSESVISDGGVVRVVDNLQSFDEVVKELIETQTLVETYKSELETMKNVTLNTRDIVAESVEMHDIINLAIKVSKVDTTVLIEGESGVGKGIISKFIHENSKRKDEPFIKIDCSSIPEHLLESELFGYVKGAFTGAENLGKVGQIELANNGTLFLDEIGELPMTLQTKLLRVLQDKQIIRLGSNDLIDVDIRIIAATNKDLEKMVSEKSFRKDLFYRLKVVPIVIPPLKNRISDIKKLLDITMEKLNKKHEMNKRLEKKAVKRLLDYDWPGNIRELENIIEYLMVTVENNTVREEDLPENIFGAGKNDTISIDNTSSMKDAVKTLEIKLLIEAMNQSTSIEGMSKLLKMDRSTISRKLKKYKVNISF